MLPVAPASAAAVVASLPPGPPPARGLAGGYVAATVCFVIWGTVPLFWSLLGNVTAGEILVHRVFWSGLFTLTFLLVRGRGRDLFGHPRRVYLLLLGSATTVSINWGIYIWAVNAGRVVETSLGYFLSPLVMALFGVLFFHERLRPARTVAFVLAGAGVANLVLRQAGFPWVAVGLCLSWGGYSVLRKKLSIDPVVGLILETVVLAPFAFAWAIWLLAQGASVFALGDLRTNSLLAAGGLVTAIPLIAFAEAARRLPLNGLAFLQFLTPTLTFVLGVTVFAEPFDRVRAFTFACIWLGVIIFAADAAWSQRRPPAGVKH